MCEIVNHQHAPSGDSSPGKGAASLSAGAIASSLGGRFSKDFVMQTVAVHYSQILQINGYLRIFMPLKSGKLRNNYASRLFSICGHKFDASLEGTEYRKNHNSYD
jgi:hypothetical protein